MTSLDLTRRLLAGLALLSLTSAAIAQQAAYGTITIELFEARGYEDARPFGEALASISMTTGVLPWATWGDPDGEDDGDGGDDVVMPPTTATPLDLAPMAAVVEPGKSYTLVLTVSGPDMVFVRTVPVGSSSGSGVALRKNGETDYAPQAFVVPRTVDGMRSFTQTASHDVVNRVTATITLDDGTVVKGTSVVAGQVAVSNPWLGVIPDETQTLEQHGQ